MGRDNLGNLVVVKADRREIEYGVCVCVWTGFIWLKMVSNAVFFFVDTAINVAVPSRQNISSLASV